MNLPRFTYHAPASLNECVAILDDLGNNAEILAGGSDLFVRMKLRLTAPGHLVSLCKIAELKNVTYRHRKGLTIGAGATLSLLASDSTVREKCPAIADAAELVATQQIRNSATLGGNVLQNTRCQYYNRSPVWSKATAECFKRGGKVCHVVPKGKKCFAVYQSDLAPLLIGLGATATVVSKTVTEEISVESMYSGDGKMPFNALSGRLITRFTIPEGSLDSKATYKKYRLRGGMDFPLAGVAVVLKQNNGSIQNLKICLTGVASSPVLVPCETAKGMSLGRDLARETGKSAYAAAHPLANLEGDPAKRRSMIRIITEDILASPAMG
jgi:4-hydroxybenzoyl-CoA reductase subunit beta